MAARGNFAKEQIKNKILEIFPGSFLYDNGKEIRVSMMEDGSPIQVKINLVCAKTNVEPDGDIAVSGEVAKTVDATEAPPANFMNEPTDEEKASVKSLLETLGLA